MDTTTTQTYTLADFIEHVWVLGCSRCANEGISYEDDGAAAVTDLSARGWTIESPRVFCPACNGERR